MTETPDERRRNWALRLAMVATVLVLVVLFIAENFVIVELRLITMQLEARLAWAVLAGTAIGLVAGLLLARLWR